MHTVWKGSISFGLVNIPIKMFASTDDHDIKFKYLHKDCNTPVKYKKVCPVCDKELTADQIVKGYEYEPGKFVILKDEDFKALAPDQGKSVEIVDFVNLKDIDPIFFQKTYYLSPQDNGSKAYNLLREAMNTTGRIAVAKITIRDKQSLAVLRVYHNLLVLETIFHPDEIRDVSQVPNIPANATVDEKELTVAKQLIDNLTTEFDASKYKDEYREKVIELIEKRISGQEVVIKEEARTNNIIDLMQALQQSVKETQPKTTKAEPKEQKKKRTTKKATAS